MPQMSPMWWFIFPWILVLMILLSVALLKEDKSLSHDESKDMLSSKKLLW